MIRHSIAQMEAYVNEDVCGDEDEGRWIERVVNEDCWIYRFRRRIGSVKSIVQANQKTYVQLDLQPKGLVIGMEWSAKVAPNFFFFLSFSPSR